MSYSDHKSKTIRCLPHVFALCVIAAAFVLPTNPVPAAHASGVNYIPLAPIEAPGSEFNRAQADCIAPKCFPRYLRTIYNVGIGIAGLFAVISIVRGGFTLVWTDSFLAHSEAKGIILRALGGLLIVYSSYILMNIASPSLGRDLDLSLDADSLKSRLTIQKEKGRLEVVEDLTDRQLRQREQGTAKRVKEENDKITKAKEELPKLEDQLKAALAAGDYDYADFLDAEIAKKNAEIIQSQNAIIRNQALLSSDKVTNARSYAQTKIALANAEREGGAIPTFKASYEELRKGLSANPGDLAKSYTDEFERIMAVHSGGALNFIEKANDDTYGARDEGAQLTQDVNRQIVAIKTAQQNQKSMLAAKVTDRNLASREEARIDALAKTRICSIKESCIKNFAAEYCPAVAAGECSQ